MNVPFLIHIKRTYHKRKMSFALYLLLARLCILRFLEIAEGADIGACQYDQSSCSCKFGEVDQGICWTVLESTLNSTICQSRYCRQGWTCSCAGRTHLCNIESRTAWGILASNSSGNSFNAVGLESTCEQKTVQVAAAPALELGGWIGTFSETGMRENVCNEFTWWLNGEEMNAFGRTPIIGDVNILTELQDRSIHLNYPLEKGDLVSFRFRGASYFCQLSHYIFNVNGSIYEITNRKNSNMIRFAREFSTGWYQPWFLPQIGTDEYTAEPWQFVPLRESFFSNGTDILPKVDYFKTNDDSRDHEITNFYFRVQL